MGKMKKKYENGSVTSFIGRNQAIKKLQLTIADFRRLCILKGVYPVEPKNKKKVNKGSTTNRTFYYAKDISFLANEPIVQKFRDFKVYVKRLKRAKGRRDIKAIGRVRANKPNYKVDHIVKERYPTYTDAIRDLDDCLSLIFLFSVLPKSKRVYVERVNLCRRLSLEFMHYVIASKALRKCFISIKGYYFQAEIKSQKVTWVMPHKLAYQTPDAVDYRIMSTFVEFYSILLGFINFKAYQDLGLIYPPKLSISQKADVSSPEDKLNALDFNDEYLASLNCDFLKFSDNEDGLKDEFHLIDEENPETIEKVRLEEEKINKLKNLFKGLKFFLNREVPREQFVLAIKSFSGEVSWDKTSALGSTYQEDDESITHQVIDRTLDNKTYLNRVYIQPQWIFDCINENILLPVDDYLPGTLLPPHLSPFTELAEGSYVPPEKLRLIRMKLGLAEEQENEKTEKELNKSKLNNNITKPKEAKIFKDTEKNSKNNNKSTNGQLDCDSNSIKPNEDIDTENEENFNDMKIDLNSSYEEDDQEKEKELLTEEKEEFKKTNDKSLLTVVRSKAKYEKTEVLIKKLTDEEKKLSELMIPKKNKKLYSKIMHSIKKEKQEVEKLKEKREKYENTVKKLKINFDE